MDAQALKKTANEVRKGIVTACFYAKAGHPGGALSSAEIYTYLYMVEMNVNPARPDDPDRDRFVLSKGHSCPGLYAVMAEKAAMCRAELAHTLARTLTDRPRLLRLLSMNLYDMEANSRPECLAEFKRSFGASLDAVSCMLEKYVPEMDEAARQRFLYAFFPFIYGIYPYTAVTDKQKAAMELAGIPYVYQSAYDLTYHCLEKMLNIEEA